MRNALLIAIAIATCGTALGQVKQKVAECVERELAKVRTTASYAVEGGVTCRAGIIKDFKCDKENKNQVISYVAPEGFVVISSKLDVMSKTDRGAVGNLTWDQKGASAGVSCAGNACDKGDREWSGIKISGTVQRLPTETDRKAAMDLCLDEVLK